MGTAVVKLVTMPLGKTIDFFVKNYGSELEKFNIRH